jgi:hypothetical protein
VGQAVEFYLHHVADVLGRLASSRPETCAGGVGWGNDNDQAILGRDQHIAVTEPVQDAPLEGARR